MNTARRVPGLDFGVQSSDLALKALNWGLELRISVQSFMVSKKNSDIYAPSTGIGAKSFESGFLGPKYRR
ncbi:MAG: hypothetical protein NT166_26700 [Candidatus Aminicenantes bacterium]|nr:hypothetical protein [Candidatus Aminicenantes bacterium]